MIFIVLGTQNFQLNRLLREMDELAASGRIKEQIFAQIGFSTYCPQNYAYTRFLDKSVFDMNIGKADLVITHGGISTIITANRMGKPTIVYPRLARYKEHVDDHQCEIAKNFAERGFILYCHENDDLFEIITKARTTEFKRFRPKNNNILQLITDFLDRVNSEESCRK